MTEELFAKIIAQLSEKNKAELLKQVIFLNSERQEESEQAPPA